MLGSVLRSMSKVREVDGEVSKTPDFVSLEARVLVSLLAELERVVGMF